MWLETPVSWSKLAYSNCISTFISIALFVHRGNSVWEHPYINQHIVDKMSLKRENEKCKVHRIEKNNTVEVASTVCAFSWEHYIENHGVKLQYSRNKVQALELNYRCIEREMFLTWIYTYSWRTSKIFLQFVPVACSITAKCCFTML